MRVTPLNLGAGMVLVVAIAVGANQRASVWDGVYTAAQAQRGAPLYEKDCAECHGADLTGGEMDCRSASFLSACESRCLKGCPGGSVGKRKRIFLRSCWQ